MKPKTVNPKTGAIEYVPVEQTKRALPYLTDYILFVINPRKSECIVLQSNSVAKNEEDLSYMKDQLRFYSSIFLASPRFGVSPHLPDVNTLWVQKYKKQLNSNQSIVLLDESDSRLIEWNPVFESMNEGFIYSNMTKKPYSRLFGIQLQTEDNKQDDEKSLAVCYYAYVDVNRHLLYKISHNDAHDTLLKQACQDLADQLFAKIVYS